MFVFLFGENGERRIPIHSVANKVREFNVQSCDVRLNTDGDHQDHTQQYLENHVEPRTEL